MNQYQIYLLGLTGVVALGVACKATSTSNTFDESTGGASATSGPSGSGGASSTEASGVGGWDPSTGSSSMTGNPVCNPGPDDDFDGDGYTIAQGDCNDCDPNVNPGAIEVEITTPDGSGEIPEAVDEDCDGIIDNVEGPCDDALVLNDPDPRNGARAIEMCRDATPGGKDWGVLYAQYVRANGNPAPTSAQFGILDSFGPNNNVQGGMRMLGISSGRARATGQPNTCGGYSCTGTGTGTAPSGFPQDVPSCPGSNNINDDIGLQVHLRAPKNATGYAFTFRFFSYEYPEWVCTSYNDQFIALVSPPPQGSINGNISFDSQLNPVSVNVAYFDVCAGCPLGTAELVGTGFDLWNDAGATSWLQTTAPVNPGEEFNIRFAIWDTGDTAFDSTALIDNFRWIATGGTVVVGTIPEPEPE